MGRGEQMSGSFRQRVLRATIEQDGTLLLADSALGETRVACADVASARASLLTELAARAAAADSPLTTAVRAPDGDWFFRVHQDGRTVPISGDDFGPGPIWPEGTSSAQPTAPQSGTSATMTSASAPLGRRGRHARGSTGSAGGGAPDVGTTGAGTSGDQPGWGGVLLADPHGGEPQGSPRLARTQAQDRPAAHQQSPSPEEDGAQATGTRPGGVAAGLRHRRWLLPVAVVASTALVGLLLAGSLRDGSQDAKSVAPAANAVPANPDRAAGLATWNGMALPISEQDGPRDGSADVAHGFSRSEFGAALAAAHLSVRIDPYAGPDSFRPTILKQTHGGDPRGLAKATQQRYELVAEASGVEFGRPIPADTGRIDGWRIEHFDPERTSTVHLLVSAPDGQALDFAIQVIWVSGDFQLVDPRAAGNFLRTDNPDPAQYTAF